MSDQQTRNARYRPLCTPCFCSDAATQQSSHTKQHPMDRQCTHAPQAYIHKPQMSYSQSLTQNPAQNRQCKRCLTPPTPPVQPPKPTLCAAEIGTFTVFLCVFLTTRQSMMPTCSPSPFLTSPHISTCIATQKTVLLRCVYCLT
jgi:hypothetical protein